MKSMGDHTGKLSERIEEEIRVLLEWSNIHGRTKRAVMDRVRELHVRAVVEKKSSLKLLRRGELKESRVTWH